MHYAALAWSDALLYDRDHLYPKVVERQLDWPAMDFGVMQAMLVNMVLEAPQALAGEIRVPHHHADFPVGFGPPPPVPAADPAAASGSGTVRAVQPVGGAGAGVVAGKGKRPLSAVMDDAG